MGGFGAVWNALEGTWWWPRLLLVLSVLLQRYLGSVLDCPPTCSCSPTNIYCNKSDNSKFFPLLSFQGHSSNTSGIEELFQNITSIYIDNWTGLQTLRDVDMELYTGLQRLTITRSNLHYLQARVFSKNPQLRYINLSKNHMLTTLSWQVFDQLQLYELHLEDVVFECGCGIRWLQLWQQRGEAGLGTQELYCEDDYGKVQLQDMNISGCELPDISVSHSNLTVVEGDRVVATCNGTGSPLPEVDWPVTGLQSVSTQEAALYENTIHSIKITIVNVSRDDNNFLLTCIATNIVGMTNASVQLTVHFPPSIVRLREPEQRHDTCIEFTVRGSPQPMLRWFYNGEEISHTEFVRLDMDTFQDYVEGCLTFKNPTHRNNGHYMLEAINYLGVANSTVYGHFLNKPFDELEMDYDYATPTAETHKPEDTFGVSIAVGLLSLIHI